MSTFFAYAFKDYIQNGLGADLVRLTGLMAKARACGGALCLVRGDIWDHAPEGASDRGWTFYFEETLPLVDSPPIPRIELSGYEKTPLPSTLSDMSKFEYRSRLLKEIYRPRSEFKTQVNDYIEKYLSILLEQPYTLIHIRRGDKVAGPWRETQLISIDKYLEHIPRDTKTLLFIMTDSPSVITEIEELKKSSVYSHCEFVWDRNEIRRDGYSFKLYHNGYSDEEKIDEMVTNMKNLTLMQNAAHLIGARSSFLFIAGELLNGRPGISLEENLRYPTDLE